MLFRAKEGASQRTEESRIGRALKALRAYSLAQLVDGQVTARFRDDLGRERVKVSARGRPVRPQDPRLQRSPANIVGGAFHARAARRGFVSGAFEAGLPIEDIRVTERRLSAPAHFWPRAGGSRFARRRHQSSRHR